MRILRRYLLFSLLLISLFSLIFLLPSQPSTTTIRRPFSNSSNSLPPPPKIAYFISGTDGDGPRITRLLQAIYHPRNHYLLHLDYRSSPAQRNQLAQLVSSVDTFMEFGNVNVIEKGNPVQDEGSTPLALLLHAASILLRCHQNWDWFLNLDASDYPLIPQDDFLHILSFVPKDLNFIDHTSNLNQKESQRITEIVVDPRIYLPSKGRMFSGTKTREIPTAFKIFTGSHHLILSRKLIEFTILGWENFPRTLLLYFSNSKFSHKSYFQTLARNSRFSNKIINSSLHFVEWDDYDPPIKEPRNLSRRDFTKMVESRAAFAGKFAAGDPVLDMIDSRILRRRRGMIAPGGWCLGGPGNGRGSCVGFGDVNIIRPGSASKRFEKLLLNVMSNSNVYTER